MQNFIDNNFLADSASLSQHVLNIHPALSTSLNRITTLTNDYHQSLNHYLSTPVMQLNADIENHDNDSVLLTRKLLAKTSSKVRWQMIQLAQADYWDLLTDWALINYCHQHRHRVPSHERVKIDKLIKKFYAELQTHANEAQLQLGMPTSNQPVIPTRKPYQPRWQQWMAQLDVLTDQQQQTLQSIKQRIQSLKQQYHGVPPKYQDVLRSPLLLVNVPSQRLLEIYRQSERLAHHWQQTQHQLRRFDTRGASALKRFIIYLTKRYRQRFKPETAFTQNDIQHHLINSQQLLNQVKQQQLCMRRAMKQRLNTSLNLHDNACDDVALQLNESLESLYARPFNTIDYEKISDLKTIKEKISKKDISTLVLEKSRGLTRECRVAFVEFLADAGEEHDIVLQPPTTWQQLAHHDPSLLSIVYDQDLLFSLLKLPERLSPDFRQGQLLTMLNEQGDALWHNRTLELSQQAAQCFQHHLTNLKQKRFASKACRSLISLLEQAQHNLSDQMQSAQSACREQIITGLSQHFAECLAMSDNNNSLTNPIIQRTQLFLIKQLELNESQAHQTIVSCFFMSMIHHIDGVLTQHMHRQDSTLRLNQAIEFIERYANTVLSTLNDEEISQRFKISFAALKAFYSGIPTHDVNALQQVIQPWLLDEKIQLTQYWQTATRFNLLQSSQPSEIMMEFAETFCPELAANRYHQEASIRSNSLNIITEQLQAIHDGKHIEIDVNTQQHIQTLRVFANSSSEVHQFKQTDNPISPQMLQHWQQEWSVLQQQAATLLKETHPDKTPAIIHALPILQMILHNTSSTTDDLAYTRLQQLMHEQPKADSLNPNDVRLFDSVKNEAAFKQATLRSMKRRCSVDENISLNTGLAILLSFAQDKETLDTLFVALLLIHLQNHSISTVIGKIDGFLSDIENTLSPYQRLSTNQQIINHCKQRLACVLSNAVNNMQQSDSELSALLSQTDCSQLLQQVCHTKTLVSYRFTLVMQWFNQHRFDANTLQECPYGNSITELHNYLGQSKLIDYLQILHQDLQADKNDSVLVTYCQRLLSSNHSPLALESIINPLQSTVSERFKALTVAKNITQAINTRPDITFSLMKKTFSTIDPTLLHCAHAVSATLCQQLSKTIKNMVSDPMNDALIHQTASQLKQLDDTIATITQQIPSYQPAFKSLTIMINNIQLWIEQGRDTHHYPVLFERLAEFKQQLNELSPIDQTRCCDGLQPLWHATGQDLMLDYDFFNRQQKIEHGGQLVNVLSRLGALFGNTLEKIYRAVYQQYQQTVANLLPHCPLDDQLTLKIQRSWTNIFYRSRFFTLADMPVTTTEQNNEVDEPLNCASPKLD